MINKLNLQVGKTYIDRGGHKVTITSSGGHVSFPFWSEDACRSYTTAGSYRLDERSMMDLESEVPSSIEECVEPEDNQESEEDPKLPEGWKDTNRLVLEAGKTYLDREGRKVKVKLSKDTSMYAFQSEYGRTYTDRGRCYEWRFSTRDLVSEYVEPTTTEATPSTLPEFTPHIWYFEIRAFADGRPIESSWNGVTWNIDLDPRWNNPNLRFRVQPAKIEVKPNIVRYLPILEGRVLGKKVYPDQESGILFETQPSIRIEFNPNAGTLVSATMVDPTGSKA